MTFTRPENVSLLQMAQWVDVTPLTEDNKDMFVEYLYHLSLANAQQRYLFNEPEKYDDFALFCVSKLLIRLSNTAAAPVKSIVNYIKNVLTPWHAEYVRCFCCGNPDLDVHNFDISDFADYLIDLSGEYDYASYNVGCLNISDAILKHMKLLPKRKRSAEWCNIYISCLLTLQDRIEAAISLCNNILAQEEPQLTSRVIRSLKTRPPKLFHLDDNWAAYISVIVNELVHAIATELTFATSTMVTPSSCLKNLVIAARNEEDT